MVPAARRPGVVVGGGELVRGAWVPGGQFVQMPAGRGGCGHVAMSAEEGLVYGGGWPPWCAERGSESPSYAFDLV